MFFILSKILGFFQSFHLDWCVDRELAETDLKPSEAGQKRRFSACNAVSALKHRYFAVGP
jgi:hypothetical protein